MTIRHNRRRAGTGLAAVIVIVAACRGVGDDRPPPSIRSERPPAPRPVDRAEPAAVDLAALRAIGYVATAPTDNPADRGVTRHAPAAHPGLNLYTSRRRAGATLIDMDGRVIHRWSGESTRGTPKAWMHVEPLPDGSLIVVSMDSHLSKVAWDSSLIWRNPLRAHHDVAVRDDGTILALVRGRRTVEVEREEVTVLADAVVWISSEGEAERRVELLPLLRGPFLSRRLSRIRAVAGGTSDTELLRDGGGGDVLHANSIEILRREIPGVAPAGALLLSFRAIHRVAIFDAELTELLWVWGRGELEGQHDATQLADGRLLIFDNGTRRGQSRALEVDPATGRVDATVTTPGLFTRLRGGAQRLPNGNTLITESDAGHVLELTPDGEVVWELWNPDVTTRGGRARRGVIYRLNRFQSDQFPTPR